MNTVSIFSFLLLWTNISVGDDDGDLTVTLLNTYVMPDDTGFNVTGSESVEYDSDNNLWYFVDWGDNGVIGSISGDFPVDSTNANIQYDITNLPIGSSFSSGMVYLNGYLYVGNLITGILTQINIDTKEITNTVQVHSGLNGLCYV